MPINHRTENEKNQKKCWVNIRKNIVSKFRYQTNDMKDVKVMPTTPMRNQLKTANQSLWQGIFSFVKKMHLVVNVTYITQNCFHKKKIKHSMNVSWQLRKADITLFRVSAVINVQAAFKQSAIVFKLSLKIYNWS